MRFKTILGLLTAILILASVSGCRLFHTGVGRISGADPIIDPETGEFGEHTPKTVDLKLLICPDVAGDESCDCADELEAIKKFDDVYSADTNAEKGKMRRNSIQEYLIAKSNQRFAEFEQHLQSVDSTGNTILGSLTTLLAGLGGIANTQHTANVFGAAAGITSGVRAEINENYFANKTIQVLTNGMRVARKEILDDIRSNQSKDLTEYPLTRAIADVQNYHGEASLIAGLRNVALSVERASDPGVEHLRLKLKNSPFFKDVFQGSESSNSPADSNSALSDLTSTLQKILSFPDRLKNNKAAIEEVKVSLNSLNTQKDFLDLSDTSASDKRKAEIDEINPDKLDESSADLSGDKSFKTLWTEYWPGKDNKTNDDYQKAVDDFEVKSVKLKSSTKADKDKALAAFLTSQGSLVSLKVELLDKSSIEAFESAANLVRGTAITNSVSALESICGAINDNFRASKPTSATAASAVKAVKLIIAKIKKIDEATLKSIDTEKRVEINALLKMSTK
ncbi:MAG: hypothetical protein HY286_01400 [Planctomycetes bacterium]|nr:hypothetical protein [Planctomycetota bacterium]